MRLDQLLVSRGLAPTRSAAQRLIAARAVRWNGPKGWAVPKKAGEDVTEDCELEVTDDAELRFVSRGGLKLAGALERCGIHPSGLDCLDIGQGTGGFTDVLLQRGARHVVGIDVGRGQINSTLAADPRVTTYEGINARDIAGSAFEAALPPDGFAIVVADVSFITLTHVLPTVARCLASGGNALLLVKPQFELQPVDIGKGGIVKGPNAYIRVQQRIRDACAALALDVRDYFQSPIDGGDGNHEFFVWATPAAGATEAKP
ncbi:TlyA family RNA methyltransferase [Piscinibacter koreensis]|uniref:TlyA family RNA methyltransferase n=1 Tax=Piscinibacter koreensis TaxID=2742824 RepID=A0A7Y6TWX7_9BURK|nr:TlyA family RNA methyltransferase [Schlegelella koreensis]NUZ06482.1 TlyA family RNA methyltransferase [Schlegelella koreensis]